MGPDDVSRLVKKYAAKQKVRIALTEEQLSAIAEHLRNSDPRSPTEITFTRGRRAGANLKVAGYWYAGDTCCV